MNIDDENDQTTTDDDIVVTEVKNNARKRECDECKNEYVFKSEKSRFCSDKCRNLHGVKSRKQKMNGTAANDQIDRDDYNQDDDHHRNDSSTKLVGSLKGLDVQSQYIITHQRDIITDLKEKRSKLETRVENLTTQRDELQKKLDRIELENSLGMAAKSGLNGISENPLVLKVLDHVGPSLGAWLSKLAEGKGSGVSQLTGMENLSQDVQRQVMEISQWYTMQPEPVQQSVYAILDSFANAEPEKQLPMLLKQMTNLLKNGTSATSNRQYTGTFN